MRASQILQLNALGAVTYLRADRDAPYGTVVKAMSAAREAGSDQLGIVTEAE